MKVLRKTKIICTLGPSSDTEEKIRELALAGMNVARINCSHGDPEKRRVLVDIVKKVRKDLDLPIAIMFDTKGPEFRIGRFKNREIMLNKGDKFTLTTKNIMGTNRYVSVTYKNLCNEMHEGDIILINDGLVKLQVLKVRQEDILCETLIGGVLSNNKSMNFPGKDLKMEFVSPNDYEDIVFAAKNDIDYIALSFVSNADNVKEVREILNNKGGERVGLIAKIENQSGIDNIIDICNEVDGVMVARGDLGVEVDYAMLPLIQKQIIKQCRIFGKFAVTSTEMLESMINNPRPTRAEISDVANAIHDGTSTIMLSGETAAGKYPVEACQAMSKIALFTENSTIFKNKRGKFPVVENNTIDAIARATTSVAVDVDAKAIIDLTDNGYTSKLISNFRPNLNIMSFITNKREYYKLAIFWGITPVPCGSPKNMEDVNMLDDYIKTKVNEKLELQKGDRYVLSTGWSEVDYGYTNSIRVENV